MDESNQDCVRFDTVRRVRWLRCVAYGEHNTAVSIQQWWCERKRHQESRELNAKRALIRRNVARARLHSEAAARIQANWKVNVLRTTALGDAALARERVELCKGRVSV